MPAASVIVRVKNDAAPLEQALSALLAASPAAAQAPLTDAYGGGGGVLGETDQGSDDNAGTLDLPVSADRGGDGAGGVAGSADEGAGTLPFTGRDVAILLLAGAVLAGTGVAVRRTAAAQPR